MADSYVKLPAFGDAHFAAPVATVVALPTTDPPNTVRLVTATYILYYYTGSAWAAVNSGGSGTFTTIALSADTNQIVLGTTNTTTITQAALSGNRTFTLPNANSNPVQPDTGAANNFLTAIAATGVISKAQPAFSNLSGTALVAQGGTNSVAALNNNRVMVSVTGAIVEASAITASRALVSDTNGIPVAAAATTTTEIGYVNGVTSAIQTQFTGKEASITSGTTAQFWRGDKSFQTLSVAAVTAMTAGTTPATGAIGEVLTATQSSVTTTNVGSTGAYGYVISLSVTAGIWQAWGVVQFQENGATLTGGLQAGITTSTTGSGINALETVLLNGLISSTTDAIASTPLQTLNISGTTTYYLNTKFSYSAGTPKHAGTITFRRIG